ncbi:MAG: hypothetical protein M3442_03545 [Chloroflexota bacterium]|nr:hypothetical protein [Chloroflexota bacterium]
MTTGQNARSAKITIVGAGARFSPGLLLGLVAQPGLAASEVTVFDLDPTRLAVVERWGRRLAAVHHQPFSPYFCRPRRADG